MDLDGDGDHDLLIGEYEYEDVSYAYENTAPLGFELLCAIIGVVAAICLVRQRGMR